MSQSVALSNRKPTTRDPMQTLLERFLKTLFKRPGVMLIVALLLVSVSSAYLPFEQILLFLQQHQEFHLAGLFFVALMMSLVFVFWSIWRQRELQHQVAARQSQAKELEETIRTCAQLDQLTNLLNSCSAIEEASMVISHFAQQLFPGYPGGLYVFRHNRNVLEGVAAWGMELSQESLFTPDQCWALRQGQMYNLQDPEMSVLCQHVNHCDPYLCLPITSHGELLGLLHLHSNESTAKDGKGIGAYPALVMEFAQHVALAFFNLKLRDALHQQAIRDPLTGLFNRSYLDEILTTETERARRNKAPYSLIILDIDNFKEFNDIYGHEAGDTVLQALARMLLRHTHGNDTAFRIGGEEFALVMPGASTEVAWKRAGELCEAVRSLQADFRGQTLGPGSISVGVATFPNHGEYPQVIIEAADASLFQAKMMGRDRVAIAA